MLYVRWEKEIPKSFKGEWKQIKMEMGAKAGKYIQLNIENFIEKDKYDKLLKWIKSGNGVVNGMQAGFNLWSCPKIEEYWSIDLTFQNSSCLDFRNKSLIKLVDEFNKFIDWCC